MYKLFNDKKDFTQNTVGIQVLGVMVVNGIAPYKSHTSSVSINTYFEDFTANMDSHKKEVYQASAEVLGLCLKYFANQDAGANILLKN